MQGDVLSTACVRTSYFCITHAAACRVQVAFGGLGTETCKKLDTCSFEDAFNLALGIGIQNFPEGLAVSHSSAAWAAGQGNHASRYLFG